MKQSQITVSLNTDHTEGIFLKFLVCIYNEPREYIGPIQTKTKFNRQLIVLPWSANFNRNTSSLFGNKT
jgi:hypothetical protein